MAITQAKIGLSMKKLTTAPFLRGRRGRGGGRRSSTAGARTALLGIDVSAGLGELQALDDHAVAGLEAVRHEPHVPDGARR